MSLTVENAPVPEPEVTTSEERAIASLVDHPGFIALKAAYQAHEDAWLMRIASQIKNSPKPLDQTAVTFARGYFRGATNMIERVAAAAEKVRGATAE